MHKFQNRYRIQSARLKNWNYGSPGLYFITICTRDRQHYFGEIANGEITLNNLGQIARCEWEKTPQVRPNMNLQLGEFVVMPNHFHGIIIIGENDFNTTHVDGGRDAMRGVSTMDGVSMMSMDNTIHHNGNKFGPQTKNLASIIRGFKSAVTTFARKNNLEFGWQERFHDHIIRNHNEYLRISNYIINNPLNWQEDKFFT